MYKHTVYDHKYSDVCCFTVLKFLLKHKVLLPFWLLGCKNGQLAILSFLISKKMFQLVDYHIFAYIFGLIVKLAQALFVYAFTMWAQPNTSCLYSRFNRETSLTPHRQKLQPANHSRLRTWYVYWFVCLICHLIPIWYALKNLP